MCVKRRTRQWLSFMYRIKEVVHYSATIVSMLIDIILPMETSEMQVI